METMERYSYSIHPFRTITDIIPGKGIRKPMTLKLTKEEVLKCMEKGPVYRAFPDRPYVRVTRSNLDSLHVSSLDVDTKLDKPNHTEIKKELPQTETVVPEEPKNEAPTEPIEKEKQEEKKFPYAVSKQVGNTVETDIIENEEQEKRYYEANSVTTSEDLKKELPESETVATDNEPVTINTEGEVLAAEAPVEDDEDPGDLRNEEEESEVVEETEEEVEETPEEAGQPLQPVSSNNYNRKKNKHRH